jgi:hypothetical protein
MRQQDVLGEEQWAWLEAELADPERRGAVTIIGSGIVAMPRNDRLIESWAVLHPQSLAKLLSLLALHPRPRVFWVSGDIHVSQLMRETCSGVLGYPIYEFTSSGLTHSFGGDAGAITALTMHIALNAYTRVGFAPADDDGTLSAEVLQRSRHGRPRPTKQSASAGAYFGGNSFGEIEIVWPELLPASSATAGGGATLRERDAGGSLTWRAIDATGTVQFEHSVPFEFLAPWPSTFHASNGLVRVTPADLRACAAAGLAGGLTTECAAVLASCDGHRSVDLSIPARRASQTPAVVFRLVMTIAAVTALVGTPALLLALMFMLSDCSPLECALRCRCRRVRWARMWHVLLPVLCVLLSCYAAAWWRFIVMPFED